MASDVLSAGLAYAALGWRVFPILELSSAGGCECGADCSRPGKHPAIKDWPSKATTDPKTIRTWWSEHPNRGIGIATGEASGITVLDIDGDTGLEQLGKLQGGEAIPTTPCAQSRPGHMHYYFRYNANIRTGAKKIADNLDTRSDGGYVVAPPSRHISGTLYRWITNPSKTNLAEWPEFLSGETKSQAKPGRPQKESFNPANPNDAAKLKEALSYINPDDEERWAQIGWILGRAYRQSDTGFAVYSAWAGRSRKFNAKASRGHYYEGSKAQAKEKKTTNSIYAWAAENGWEHKEPEETEERKHHVFESPFREEKMVKEMATAAAAAPGVFRMGTRLVHIVRYSTATAQDVEVDRDPMSYVVLDHNVETLAVELSNIAAYWSIDKKGWKRSQFRRSSIRTFMECKELDGIKPLLSFVPHQALRTDGTLIKDIGYDPKSQLYITSAVDGVSIRDKLRGPTIRAEIGKIMNPFSQYPWSGKVDRCVFLAALMTVGLRHWFDTAPAFGFSSPVRGSGKTLLTEAISLIWYGTTLSKTQWAGTPEEREKRWSSFLLAGDRLIGIDNVPVGVRVDDPTLNMALTSRTTKYRILGRTERVELANEATWLITGNQLNITGDLVRRCLVCYIDPKLKNPNSRKFEISDLQAHIKSNRAQLISACLSLVASWINAGRPQPKDGREFGGFNAWYSVMRGLLLWAGEGDLQEAIELAEEEDTETADMEEAANALRKLFPPEQGAGLRQGELLSAILRNQDTSKTIASVLPHGLELNRRTLQDLLRALDKKVFTAPDVGGVEFRIVRARVSEHQFLLRVEYLK